MFFMDQLHKPRIAPPLKAPLKKNLLIISPRKTGKSFYLKSLPQVDLYLNLQESDTFRKLSYQKNIIENLLTADIKTVALDNFHRLPSLLDQVEHLNKTKGVHFILSASNEKAFNSNHAALHADKTDRISLLPFCFEELKNDFQIENLLKFGSLPAVYNQQHQDVLLNDYVGLLFQEDLIQSGQIKKIENFSRFLNTAALANGQFQHFEDISRDCDVPSRTVREYFQLLKQLRLGYEISCIQSTPQRKAAARSKFYFFDIGVVNALRNDFGTDADFEKQESNLKHFLLLELMAYKLFKKPDLKVEFWCDYQGNEIDFVLNGEIALEVRATKSLNNQHFRRMKKFMNKDKLKRHLLVSQDSNYVAVENIEHQTVKQFLQTLWNGHLI